MRTIVIAGAGELGGALARQIAAAEIARRVVLLDDEVSVAAGKALDILQAAPVDGYATVLHATDDESAVVGAHAVVIADRARDNREWDGDDGVSLVRRLTYLNASAMVVCAGAAQLEVVERGVREVGIARDRLLGSAPEALRSAVMSMTALEAGCSPTDVSLSVLGRPPAHTLVPWEDASIAGRRASEVLSPPAIARLDRRLSRLWPPGPLTLASAAARLLAAAARADRRTVHAFAAITRDGSSSTAVAMLPVTLNDRGILSVIAPTLTARDRVRLDTVLSGFR